MKKCVNFIAANDTFIKMKALDLVLHGVIALRNGENDLLPLIHKLWPAIIRRLKDTDKVRSENIYLQIFLQFFRICFCC